MIKVRVRIPVYLNISEPTKKGIRELLSYKGGEYQFNVAAGSGSYLPVLRNDLVNDKRSHKTDQSQEDFDFDYFLTIDSDVGFGLKDVLKLLSYNKSEFKYPILSGIIETQNVPEYLTAGYWKDIPGDCTVINSGEKGFKKVDWVGAAFLLIHKSVFQKTPYPWFQGDTIRYGEYSIQPSEDVGFCINTCKAGFEIYCDFDMLLEHVHRGSPYGRI